jgi:hypothetical protein
MGAIALPLTQEFPMANVVVKSAFIEAMISSGRHPEEAELDWIQYLEDMADYRAVKYGNFHGLTARENAIDQGWEPDEECDPEMDMHDMEDYQPTQYELDMEARAKWANGGDIHPSWNKPAHTDTWDREKDGEFPF